MYGPVMAGFWSHKDLVEDVFTFEDLLDATEMLQVRAENDFRAAKAAKNDH